MSKIPLRELRRRYERGISNGADDVADAFMDESTKIIEAEAVDQGTLLRSGEIRRPAYNRRVIAWTSAHAGFVHWGTRPHWPPLAPILAWVRRNLRTVMGADGSRYTQIRPGALQRTRRAPEAEIEEVARRIQAKIAREGTDPVPWVPRAWSRVKPKAPRLLADAIDEALK